jgi:hypothetical protein
MVEQQGRSGLIFEIIMSQSSADSNEAALRFPDDWAPRSEMMSPPGEGDRASLVHACCFVGVARQVAGRELVRCMLSPSRSMRWAL